MRKGWCEIMDKDFRKELGWAVGISIIFIIGWIAGAITVPNIPQDDIKDWRCSVTMQPDVNVVFSDTNSLISEIRIEMPCTEAMAKKLATIK